MTFPGIKKIKEILSISRGEKPGDLLLQNCRIPDIFREETLYSSVAVKNGIIAGIGNDYSGDNVIDCKGNFLVPGFIDAHIHIESSHLLPHYFGTEAIRHGTTAIFTDPHEIANATGVRGLKFFMKNAMLSPIDIYFLIPSCVPAIKLWDVYGHEIGPEEIASLLRERNVVGLAEMMNFPGVIYGDREVWKKLEAAWDRIKDGHAPLVSGKQLNAYLIGGIGSDHESTNSIEALEKISRGMFLMIREGSAAKNLNILPGVISSSNIDRIALVSDDLLAPDLIEEGHLDRILRKARKEYGISPFQLIRMVTFNPANYFGLRDRGLIAPGRIADMVLLEDLEEFRPIMTIKNGKVVYSPDRDITTPEARIPMFIRRSVRLPTLKASDFTYRCSRDRIKVIEIIPDQILTREIEIDNPQKNGNIKADPEKDLAKLAAIDRYTGKGKMAVALVKGTGIKKGAIASTYAHDTHNLIVLGVDEEDMALAANTIKRLGGGMVVVREGKILEELPLPVGGVVSDLPAMEVAKHTRALNEAARSLGIGLRDPFVTISFLSLTVIPELKLTPVGLVNLSKMEKVRC